jgi:hypothetical protein
MDGAHGVDRCNLTDRLQHRERPLPYNEGIEGPARAGVMTGRDANSIGLVGVRAYELQAWRSPGASALEHAYWAARTPAKILPLRSRLRQFVDAISARVVEIARLK